MCCFMQFRVVRENENAAGEEAQCRVSCGMGVLPTVRSQLAVRKQLRPRGEALADTRLGQVVGGVALPIYVQVKLSSTELLEPNLPPVWRRLFFFFFGKKSAVGIWRLNGKKEKKITIHSCSRHESLVEQTGQTDFVKHTYCTVLLDGSSVSRQ